MQRTVQTLQLYNFIDLQTIECLSRPYEFKQMTYKSLNLNDVSFLKKIENSSKELREDLIRKIAILNLT